MAATADLPGATYVGPRTSSRCGPAQSGPAAPARPRRGRPAAAVGAERDGDRPALPHPCTRDHAAADHPRRPCRGCWPGTRRTSKLLAPLDRPGSHVARLGRPGLRGRRAGRDVGFVLTFAGGDVRLTELPLVHRAAPPLLLPRPGRGGPVGAAHRRRHRVYDEIEARARLAPVMCLEVNLDPPNEPSLAFHRRRGYVEVGRTTPPVIGSACRRSRWDRRSRPDPRYQPHERRPRCTMAGRTGSFPTAASRNGPVRVLGATGRPVPWRSSNGGSMLTHRGGWDPGAHPPRYVWRPLGRATSPVPRW